MLTNETARARVAKGAALLDSIWPVWANHVNVNDFDLSDPCRCVLGQLNGNYHDTVEEVFPVGECQVSWPSILRIGGATENDSYEVAKAHGFDAPDSVLDAEEEADYKLLQDAWVEAIADRRIRETTSAAEQPQPVHAVAGTRE